MSPLLLHIAALFAPIAISAAPPLHADFPECAHCKALAPLAPATFDESTGRDLRAFPPHRFADFTHIALDLSIADMNVPNLSGTAAITFSPLGNSLRELSLNARCMTIRSVSISGRSVPFTHDGQTLTASFEAPIAPGESTTLLVAYEVSDPPAGLLWTPESPDWPGRAAQLHTQGEPETNSYWFPCHDSPNDRLTTELRITVPTGFSASSNGDLLSRTESAAGTTFAYSQSKDHAVYLVSLIVGKFDIVELSSQSLPMKVWAPEGRGADVPRTFGRTPQMVDLFASLTGEPYPWSKYDQLIVWNFGWGGMENTSVTTLYDTAILSAEAAQDNDLDGLISHELAHQWFGDLITCNSWEHIWLNEGFATYFTHLWFESRDGLDSYFTGVRANFDGIIAADTLPLPAGIAMVSKSYSHPWETFRKAANPYGKGASILHMLRTRLGDDRFFAGIRNYVARHRFTTAETSDLRRAFEDASGESLAQFFHQWCERPGIPHIALSARFDSSASALIVEAVQTQTIDGDNPAFEFDLPLLIEPADGPAISAALPFSGRSASIAIPLNAEPRSLAIDPFLAVLARIEVTQPPTWSSALLANTDAPLMARISAARQLRDAADASPLLESIALNPDTPTALKVECIRAAGARFSFDGTLKLLRSGPWQARAAACQAVSDRELLPFLQKVAANTPGTQVRAAALRALGRLHAGAPLIESALVTDSHEDALRQAALDATIASDSPDSLRIAIRLAQPGNLSRTRAAATQAIGSTFAQNPQLAVEALRTLITDPEVRVRLAAGEALVATEQPEALQILSQSAAAACGPDARWLFNGWIKRLSAALPESRPQ